MDKPKNNYTNIILFGLVAGQAIHYFLSGKDSINTQSWNILVAAQLVIAMGAMAWNWRQMSKMRKDARS